MSPSKILYLSPVSFLGGGERSLSTLLKFLDRNKFASLVVLPDRGPFEKVLIQDGIKVEVIPWGKTWNLISRRSFLAVLLLPLTLPEGIIYLWRLRRLVYKENIQLIHTNGLKSHLMGIILGAWCKRKVIWHIREIYHPLIKAVLNIFRLLDRVKVIAISRAVKEDFGRGEAEVIYNGVDIHTYYPFKSEDSLKEELGYSPETKLITTLGVLTPWKGQHVFIEAIAHLKNRFPDLRALIVGRELYTGLGHQGYLCYLQKMTKELGLGSIVKFLGFRTDLPRIINSSLAIVHASIKPEPFGRVLIEAMACGRPVIASRGGAVEEIVGNGQEGLIVEADNSPALARAITTLLENETMAQDMGKAGRERAERLFSAEKMAGEVAEFYERLLFRQGRSRRIPSV